MREIDTDSRLRGIATIPDLLTRVARRWPDKPAVISESDGSAVTYSQLLDQVHDVATFMADTLGVVPGERVAVMLSNRVEYPLIWLACARLGAIMVPINSAYKRSDCRFAMNHAEVVVMFTEDSCSELVQSVAAYCPSLRNIVNVDSTSIQRMVRGYDDDWPAVYGETPLNIQFTSGTTGHPKGCILSHAYWLTMARKNVLEVPGLGPDDVLLTAQPFSYMDPQWNLASAVAAGGTLVMLDRFHPSTILQSIQAYKATFFYCIGVMPTLMLKTDANPAERDHSLRLVACSGIPPARHAELEERYGVPWLDTYGMTEIGNGAAMTLADHDGRVGSGSVGRQTASRELRIMDDSGVFMPRGKVGELVVRGTGLMDGYFRDPESTARAFAGGWFRTGDLAWMDDDGFVFLAGRTKDMIRRSGENIAAQEVEEVLQSHPAVRLAACIAVPDELRGEEVKAYVVLNGDCDDDFRRSGLPAYVAEQLAMFKVPRYWMYVSELPLTISGKVAKAQLASEDGHKTGCWDRVDGIWR